MTPFVSVSLARDLYEATNTTSQLYGSDVLITAQLVSHLLKAQTHTQGLDLTHRKDRYFIHVSNIVEFTPLYGRFFPHF